MFSGVEFHSKPCFLLSVRFPKEQEDLGPCVGYMSQNVIFL